MAAARNGLADNNEFVAFTFPVGSHQVEIHPRSDRFSIAVLQIPIVFVDPFIIFRAINIQANGTFWNFANEIATQGIKIDLVINRGSTELELNRGMSFTTGMGISFAGRVRVAHKP